MPRGNYGFKGPAVLPADASSFGGVVQAGTYAYESAYGRLVVITPPGPPRDVVVSPPINANYSVSSTSGWQAGPSVNAGQTYNITASGSVQWESGGATSGPDGFSSPDVRGANFYNTAWPHEGLIGKIDNGTPFQIGSSYSFTAASSGTLYFATNDSVRGDNAGAFSVNVQSAGIAGSMSWSAPSSMGSGTFSYYQLDYSSDGGNTFVSSGTTSTTSFNYSSLLPGQTYVLSVAAVSTVGKGDAVFSTYTVPAIKPSQTTGVSGAERDTQVDLSWTAPSSNGAAITDYAVQYSTNSGSTWTTFSHTASSSASISVTGLTNGTAYVFRVAAVNSVGTGDYSSASASITPATVYLTTESGDLLITADSDFITW